MHFSKPLIKGKLINRYKRFFVDVKVDNNSVTTHCPNTGSMLGLLQKGNEVWISEAINPKRKLKFTLEIIKSNRKMIGINTHSANKIVQHGLENRLINEFLSIKNIKPEFKYSDDTRFDFLCDKNLIEVKNVTLSRKEGLAEFPDAITSRGSKHLERLIEAKKAGYKPYVLFLVQIQNASKFKIAKDIDSNYYKIFIEAKKKGVNFLAYRCKLSSKKIIIEKKILIDHG